MAVVVGAAEHPAQPWDSREEGREGEGRAREGKGEERGGDRGGSKAGRRGTRRRRVREELQGEEMKQTRKYWAFITPITQQEGVLFTYMRAWGRGKARYLAIHPCVLVKNCRSVSLQSPQPPLQLCGTSHLRASLGASLYCTPVLPGYSALTPTFPSSAQGMDAQGGVDLLMSECESLVTMGQVK